MSYKASNAQKSAIDALQKFYSIIVAGAFGGAVLKFIEKFDLNAWTVDQTSQVVLLVAFVVTIIPFYHGMERHLYETHIAGNYIDRAAGGRPSPILFDVFSFMVEGGILFALGRSLDNPETFLKLWTALIIVDICWSLIIWQCQKSEKPIWARNNFLWGFAAWFFYFVSPYFLNYQGYDPAYLSVVTAVLVGLAEISRSFFDYKQHWQYYFPDATRDEFGKITYLATPYSKGDEATRLARFNAITHVSAKLIEKKEIIFSPITMTHPIDLVLAKDGETLGSDYWVAFDESFMRACSDFKILQLPGWDKSSGVLREMQFFSERGVVPTFISPADFDIDANDQKYAAAFPENAE